MICKNPGGGTPPPNFTQGGVMDCHPPLETAYGPLGLDFGSTFRVTTLSTVRN